MPGKAEYPANHRPGMRVPKGGSMCKNCRFLGEDEKTCTNKYFIAWEGPGKPADDDKLPAPYDQYCSDWYEPGKAGHRWLSPGRS